MIKRKIKLKEKSENKCFSQLNFLGIRYDEEIYESKTKVDLGVITVEKLNK